MDSSVESPSNAPAWKNQIAVLGRSSASNVIHEVQQWFSDDNKRPFITLRNRYYEARVRLVRVDVKHSSAHLILAESGAIVVLAEKVADIEACKKAWEYIAQNANDDIVSIFVVLETLEEMASYDLIRWAIPFHIEVITSTICAEDGLSVPQRAKSAIECATWLEYINLPSRTTEDCSFICVKRDHQILPQVIESPIIARTEKNLRSPCNHEVVEPSQGFDDRQVIPNGEFCESASKHTINGSSLHTETGQMLQSDSISSLFDELVRLVDTNHDDDCITDDDCDTDDDR